MSIVVCIAMILFLQTMLVNFIFSRCEYTEASARRHERAVIASLYIGMIGYAVLAAFAIYLCHRFPLDGFDDGEIIVSAVVLVINVPLWIGGWMYEITGRKVLIILYHIFFALLILATVIGVAFVPASTKAETPTYSQQAISASTTAAEDYYVYTTPQGKKYHREKCHYISVRTATQRTIKDAKQEGYSPCSVCKPGR